MVACDARRTRTRGRTAGVGFQCLAIGVQNRSDLQGPLYRDHDGGDVRAALAAASRDPAGGGDRDRHHDDCQGRDRPGASIDARTECRVHAVRLFADDRELLRGRRGQHAVLSVNSSTPILYYNKDQFRLAGLDPDAPLATWPQVEAAARKLREKGIACGITTAWPAWINIENFSAFHDVPIATQANGIGGIGAELQINNLAVTGHIATLADWQKAQIFDYSGRTNDAERRFYNSECGILISSSAARADIIANAKFEIGYGMLPYWPNVQGAPQNSIIGGGSLWVLQGRPEAEYKGVARFFAFLSRRTARRHGINGRLSGRRRPVRTDACARLYDRNPGTDISIKQVTLNSPTDNSKGLRLGSYVIVRDIIQEELEAALSGQEGGQGRARRRGPPRQRYPAAIRKGQSLSRFGQRFGPVLNSPIQGPI